MTELATRPTGRAADERTLNPILRPPLDREAPVTCVRMRPAVNIPEVPDDPALRTGRR